MKKVTPSYIYSIIGVALVLFLLGSLGWLMLNGRGMNKFLKGNIQMQVIMHDNTRTEKATALLNILEKQKFIAQTKMITKEEAAAQFAKEYDEDFTELLDFNPLYTSLNLNLYPAYVNADSMEKIKAFLLQSNIVREVVYPKPIVNTLDSTLNRVSIILAIISAILLFSVIFLIDNTVRLSMFSSRHTIKTMQMVGATHHFIARPFDRSAIYSGLISAAVAILAILGLKYFVLSRFPELNAFNDNTLFIGLLILVLILGVLISLISTHRSVLKYLKLKVEDLY
ncbi:hypothetical protein DBR32_13745 [Taibaiella sp. KBW10]|uniref:cell division protein FtsX n=1 Tax=Taibaiella sp. KBW10 TaxID=2153357 RepID=UPI000F5A099C|nr:permease-like cell division protein FtsX [Taibaiella sp. KBW10]RQO29972.1 hypothetical protein DBR32_13745 [Taibaiella sp. KBW10]